MLTIQPDIISRIDEMSAAGLIQMARKALNENEYGDCIYFSNKVFITVARTYLRSQKMIANTEEEVLELFALHYTDSMGVAAYSNLVSTVGERHQRASTREFTRAYFNRCEQFYIDIATV